MLSRDPKDISAIAKAQAQFGETEWFIQSLPEEAREWAKRTFTEDE